VPRLGQILFLVCWPFGSLSREDWKGPNASTLFLVDNSLRGNGNPNKWLTRIGVTLLYNQASAPIAWASQLETMNAPSGEATGTRSTAVAELNYFLNGRHPALNASQPLGLRGH
jgi:hypothetical protein